MLTTDKDTSRLLPRPVRRGTECQLVAPQGGPLRTASSGERLVTILTRLGGLRLTTHTPGSSISRGTAEARCRRGNGERNTPPVSSAAPGTPRSSSDPRADRAATSVATCLWCSLDSIKTGSQPTPPRLSPAFWDQRAEWTTLQPAVPRAVTQPFRRFFFRQMPLLFPYAALTLLHTCDAVPLSPSKSSFPVVPMKTASLSRLPARPFVGSGFSSFLKLGNCLR